MFIRMMVNLLPRTKRLLVSSFVPRAVTFTGLGVRVLLPVRIVW